MAESKAVPLSTSMYWAGQKYQSMPMIPLIRSYLTRQSYISFHLQNCQIDNISNFHLLVHSHNVFEQPN
jgi:hypothetical protein